MSSNFLNKSGLSYFWQKIKEIIQGKQDKLVAGDNITIGTDNKIKAYNKVFVGVCPSVETDAVKEVSCPDWILADGNIIVVKFINGNKQAMAELNVQGSGAIYINWVNTTDMWQAGAYIAFAYDAMYEEFHAISMDAATQDAYGVVMLSDAVDLDSSSYASTPAATKQAYDLANLAKEGLTNKQDKLKAGTGITIQDNVISASGGSNKQNLYVYDIEQKILQTQGYKATVKSTGTDVVYSGYNAWSLKIKKQRVLAPEFTKDNPYPVTLACVLIVGDNTYGCLIPFYFTSSVNDVINCTITANTMFAEDAQSGTLIQYHKIGGITTSLKVTKNSVF